MRIATVCGIDIKLNLLMLLFLPLAWWQGFLNELAPLFIIVLLHEGAHALAGRLLGLSVSSIELMPFGGVATIDSPMEADPRKEGIVAAAGPVLNILAASALVLYSGYVEPLTPFLTRVLELNLSMAGMNLLPALPLDGGRMLRSMLAGSLGLKKATRSASIVGIAIGAVLAALGAYMLITESGNVSVLFTGAYVAISAARELKSGAVADIGAKLAREDAFRRRGLLAARHLVADRNTRIREVMKSLRPMRYHVITVLGEDGRVIGSITESQLDSALIAFGGDAPLYRCIAGNNKN